MRHRWKSKDELISDVLLWSLHMDVKPLADQLELIYVSSVQTQENLFGAVDDSDG